MPGAGGAFRSLRGGATGANRVQAANDALKRPGIQRIAVSLSRQDECIALMVRDDGSPTEGASSAEAMAGRELLRIRAGAIGGTLTITSQPNQGTTILCTLPQPN